MSNKIIPICDESNTCPICLDNYKDEHMYILKCNSLIPHKICIVCHINLIKNYNLTMKKILCPICRTNIEIDKYILNKIRFNQYFNRLSQLKMNVISNGMKIIDNII